VFNVFRGAFTPVPMGIYHPTTMALFPLLIFQSRLRQLSSAVAAPVQWTGTVAGDAHKQAHVASAAAASAAETTKSRFSCTDVYYITTELRLPGG